MKNDINANIANIADTAKEQKAKAAIKAAYKFLKEGDEIAAFLVVEALLTSEDMPADSL